MVISETNFGKRLTHLGKLYGYKIRFKWDIPYHPDRINIYATKVSNPCAEAMIHVDCEDIPKGDGFDLIDFVNVVFDVLKEEVDGYEIPYIEENPVNCRCSSEANLTPKEYNKMFVKKVYPTYPEIKNVIFNPPATIVFWDDGTKTVVKTQNNEHFDPEKGLSMAIAKKHFGNKGHYFEEIKKWTEKYTAEFTYGPANFDFGLLNKMIFADESGNVTFRLKTNPEGTDPNGN